ncbi:hypothetical protein [Turicimonas muris]|uniref:hypothetical protein n=1 Tax=Turicimonas muris TaxID=1796652 RepID=UPI002676FF3F|nr:hypothetical protein [Turicimonas muris]
MPHANLTQVSLCDVPVNQVCTLVKWGALDEPTVQRLNQTGILLGVTSELQNKPSQVLS